MSDRDMRFRCTNADEMEFTLSVTMRLRDWKELRDQLGNAWPSWDFGSKVGGMIRQAEQAFYPPEAP